MKIKLLNVVWHDKEPVFSIDWHPSGRIATGGADKEVKIWRIENMNSAKPTVKFVCSLVRHMGTVNSVRFSPNGRFLASGSDDGFICIWELQKQKLPNETNKKVKPESGGGNDRGKVGEEEEEEETWAVYKSIKAPARDVYDLAWSACSRFIVGGTSENTSFVGSARSGNVLSISRDHSHFIQGVSWDPQNKYIVTQSSDQTARVYLTAKGNSGKMNIRYVIKDLRLPESGAITGHKRGLQATPQQAVPPSPTKKKQKLDDKSKDTNEPEQEKGKDGGCDETKVKKEENVDEKEKKTDEDNEEIIAEEDDEEEEDGDDDDEEEEDAIEEAKSTARPKMFLSEVANTFFRRNSWSPDGTLLVLPSGIFRSQVSGGGATSTGTEPVKVANTAYVFSRGDFRRPVCHFPGHEKVVVVTKFCPVLFKLRTKTPAIPLPYRMVVAIATTDSVAIYDTETMHVLGIASKVHFSEITDLAWINDDEKDDLHLIMSSRDGFCSLISFDKDELGERLDKTEYPEVMKKISEIRNTPFKAQAKEAGGGDRTNDTNSVNSNVKNNNEEKPQRKRIKPILVSQNP